MFEAKYAEELGQNQHIRMQSSTNDSVEQDVVTTFNRKECKKEAKRELISSKQILDVGKMPPRLETHALITKTHSTIILNNTVKDLKMVYSQHGDIKSVIKCVEKRFELSKQNDIDMLNLIMGYMASDMLTGDLSAALKSQKHLAKTMHTYNLTSPGILCSLLQFNMFHSYVKRGLMGKAFVCLEKAKTDVQFYSPNMWTSLAFVLQYRIDDTLAHLWPLSRKKYQEESVKNIELARQHILQHSCHEEDDFVYLLDRNSLEKVNILLDMPLRTTLRAFDNAHIAYRRLNKYDVTDIQVLEAEQVLIRNVAKRTNNISNPLQDMIKKYILLTIIFLEIRKSQLALKSHELDLADQCIRLSYKVYYHWFNKYVNIGDPCMQQMPNLFGNIKYVMDSIYQRIAIEKQSKQPFFKHEIQLPDLSSEDPDVEDIGNIWPSFYRHCPFPAVTHYDSDLADLVSEQKTESESTDCID